MLRESYRVTSVGKKGSLALTANQHCFFCDVCNHRFSPSGKSANLYSIFGFPHNPSFNTFYSALFCLAKSVQVFYQLLNYTSEATYCFIFVPLFGVHEGSSEDSLPIFQSYFFSQL